MGATRTFAERMDMPERLWRLVCTICGQPFPMHPRPDHAFGVPPTGVVKKPVMRRSR
jgi:hypothetical protein